MTADEAPVGAFKFCRQCGARIAFVAPACPHCGTGDPEVQARTRVSPKSFATAVALCGIFGVVGVHHFYLGNILHGLFDLGLFVLAVGLFIAGAQPGQEGLSGLAWLVLLVDGLHTTVVFYRLLTGKQHDGSGRLVAYPGQI